MDKEPETPALDRVYLAPLAGYTDLPFRRACQKQGLLHGFTPMVDACSLAFAPDKNKRILVRGEDESWLGTQLLGQDPDMLGKAADILNAGFYDTMDLNLGCPVKKVTQKGGGAALGLDRDRAARCLEAVVRNSRAPVTAKLRVLHDQDPKPTVELATTLVEAGATALTIHGRVWDKVYAGPVAWQVIASVREAVNVPVVANGGVFDRRSGLELAAQTGCSRIMIARGAIGNPWIFAQFGNMPQPPPTHAEVCATMHAQIKGMVDLYGEEVGMRNARKIILAYLVGRGYRRSQRARVTSLATFAQFEGLYGEVLDEGPLCTVQGTWKSGLPDE
ncbi:MAG: tRNA-dihydrouridine synthase family protein [Lentisphaeria bacterium]|nr:tRNA-dihydrouridine synthase family protein [Lentisphaeria bacterium]